jgi:hypothetical protein
MIEKLSARVIAMIVGAVLLIGIILFGLNQCRARADGEQASRGQPRRGRRGHRLRRDGRQYARRCDVERRRDGCGRGAGESRNPRSP